MLAIRQIYEQSPATIHVPVELRNRKTEVLFIAIDEDVTTQHLFAQKQALANLAGCWQGNELVREPQENDVIRLELD